MRFGSWVEHLQNIFLFNNGDKKCPVLLVVIGRGVGRVNTGRANVVPQVQKIKILKLMTTKISAERVLALLGREAPMNTATTALTGRSGACFVEPEEFVGFFRRTDDPTRASFRVISE